MVEISTFGTCAIIVLKKYVFKYSKYLLIRCNSFPKNMVD